MRSVIHAGVKLTCASVALLLSCSCAGDRGLDVSGPPLAIIEPRLDEPLVETFPPADERPSDPVKRALLEQINRDRAAFGLPAVLWDESASRVADAFCASQIRENTTGHFLTDGLPPYARTSFAGVFGMQFENSVTWKTNASSFGQPAVELVLEGHAGMLAEKPPFDGHRRTILDPEATHVGVGWAISRGDFRMAEEFLIRHLAWLRLERVPVRAGVLLVRGAPVDGRRLRFVTIGWEPPPARLTAAQASARTSYSYPKASEAYVGEGNVTLKILDTVTSDRIRFAHGREFYFRFAPDRPGLWTLVFQTAPLRGERISQGGAVSVWFDRRAPAALAAGSQ